MSTGKELLVLGNAKSLEDYPFHLYQVDTIGMNHAYRYWKMINWYPTYYCSIDKESNTYFYKHIKDLVVNREKYGIKKFLLSRLILNKCPEFLQLSYGTPKTSEKVKSDKLDKSNKSDKSANDVSDGLQMSGRVIYFIEDMIQKKKPGFTGDFQQTSGSISARFGFYLGYSKVYLLGIDANYEPFDLEWAKQAVDAKGFLKETVRPEQNYFFEGYRSQGDYLHIPPARRLNDRPNHYQVFQVLDRLYNKHDRDKSKRDPPRIVNLNKNSKLCTMKIMPTEDIPEAWVPSGVELSQHSPKVLVELFKK